MTSAMNNPLTLIPVAVVVIAVILSLLLHLLCESLPLSTSKLIIGVGQYGHSQMLYTGAAKSVTGVDRRALLAV